MIQRSFVIFMHPLLADTLYGYKNTTTAWILQYDDWHRIIQSQVFVDFMPVWI